MGPTHSCREISIALVDDDEGFRSGLAEMLADDGHRVLEFASPADISEDRELPQVQILVSDYELPGENGFAFIDRFRRRRPDVPVILVTAYRTEAVSSQAAIRPFLRVVWKPLDYREVHALVHESADSAKPRE